MTQAGLILGKMEDEDISRKIVELSIAREKEQGIKSIKRYVNSEKEILEEEIKFEDEYKCGDYGKFNREIIQKIIEVYQNEGIPLDVIYTEKAFLGMEKYLEKNKIKGKNILFIHTGGLPIFFDNIEDLRKEIL